MADGTLNLPDPQPTREEIEEYLKQTEAKADELRAQLMKIDAEELEKDAAARQATVCPTLAEVMKRLDDIEEAIRNISIFQFPQTITTPGTVPYTPAPTPYKPYVPWWETNKIWCKSSDDSMPGVKVTYGVQVGTDFDGEY